MAATIIKTIVAITPTLRAVSGVSGTPKKNL